MQRDTTIEEFIFDDASLYFEASRKFVADNVADKGKRQYYNKIIDSKYALNYDKNEMANVCRQALSGISIWGMKQHVDYFVW